MTKPSFSGQPHVSAVVPAYNAARYIGQTIESLLKQTVQFSEIVVIDDCSCDNTAAIVSQYAKKSKGMVKIVALDSNSGASFARNCGLTLAKEDWVLLVDSDDIAEPHLLERELSRLRQLQEETPGPWLLIQPAYIEIDSEGNEIPGVHRWQQVGIAEVFGYQLIRNWVTASGVLVNREAVLSVGGFDINITYSEDWDLWLRLAQAGGFGYVDEPLFKVRRHGGNMSGKLHTMLKGELHVLRKYPASVIQNAINRRALPWEVNQVDYGNVMYRMGLWDNGFRAVKEVVDKKPEYASGIFAVGLYHLHNEHLQQALDAFKRVLCLAPENGAALNNLGAVLAVLGRREEAAQLFGQAISLFPGYIDATNNLKIISSHAKVSPTELKFTWRELRPVLTSYTG